MTISHSLSQLTYILIPFVGRILKVIVPDLFFLASLLVPECQNLSVLNKTLSVWWLQTQGYFMNDLGPVEAHPLSKSIKFKQKKQSSYFDQFRLIQVVFCVIGNCQ